MGWGGITNLPPGFDVFGGKQGQANIVDEAIRGHIEGLPPQRQEMFADLKRNLLRRDYARYFESSLACAAVLADVHEGKYLPEIHRDIIEPAIATAIDQVDSIGKDLERARSVGRALEYDAQSSLDQIYRKSEPITKAYPKSPRAGELGERYRAVSDSVRAAPSS